jgi:hypothetical protein
MLGLATRGAGAVVLIEGVVRPLTPVLCRDATGTLGPRECRGCLDWYRPGRGVADGSRAMEGLRLGIGVDGTALDDSGASDKGGEGGVMSGRRPSGLV